MAEKKKDVNKARWQRPTIEEREKLLCCQVEKKEIKD